MEDFIKLKLKHWMLMGLSRRCIRYYAVRYLAAGAYDIAQLLRRQVHTTVDWSNVAFAAETGDDDYSACVLSTQTPNRTAATPCHGFAGSQGRTFHMGILSLITGKLGASGFGSATTAEQVTDGVDASALTVIVTGGSSGIGLETSRVFALRGAHVIIAARNIEAASEARESITKANPSARVDVLKLDLSSLKSVRAFVDQFNSMNLPLNILINNAGVMSCPFQLSEDGVEMQFATNHLGHFLLTNLLLDNMKATVKSTGIEGRIVNVASYLHHQTYPKGIQFDELNDKKKYNDLKAYGQSKLANILHTKELSRMLKEEGANITVNCLHPGLIWTNISRHSIVLSTFFRVVAFLLWKNVPQGAATTCYLGLNPQMKGVTGKYFEDCNEEKPSQKAQSDDLAKQLWEFSEELVRSAE